ncbi:hypothetical protein G3A43_06760 [Paraburkholderia aspalathi]|nr:hypothetical protein [Paraburkholderia aspalathi]MBK3779951.1 hypothetical protein [Paraburkholderia aspalathi]
MENDSMEQDMKVGGTAANDTPKTGDTERGEPTLQPEAQSALTGEQGARSSVADEAAVAPSGWFARILSHRAAPVVAGVVFLAGAALFAARQYIPSIGTPSIVVFDPVKFANAQRAAASILAVSPSADLTLTMTQVAKGAEGVIREEAHGSIVLVKQAVVTPEGIPDITDAVLKRFGLPTNVPTVSTDPTKLSLESLAPTDSSFSPGKQAEDYRMELQQKDIQAAQAAAKQTSQTNVLP